MSTTEAVTLQNLQDQLDQRDQQLAALCGSSSWRLTAPLRWAGRVAKGWLNKPIAARAHAAPVLRDYPEWIAQFDSLGTEVSFNLRAQIDGFAVFPLFSILMPCQAPALADLDATLTTVQQQIYPNWELCIAAPADADAGLRAQLARWALAETRIKVSFAASARSTGSQAALANHALGMVSASAQNPSQWVLRLDAADLIANKAMYLTARVINEYRNCRIIYADEDQLDAAGQRSEPYFKCDWNPDLHESHNLIGRFGLYATALVQSVGGYGAGSDEVMDFDLSLRCVEQVKAEHICHVPQVLFHARQDGMAAQGQATLSAAGRATEAGKLALDAHFRRQGILARAENLGYGYRTRYALPMAQPLTVPMVLPILPLVSLIIPTRNGLALLRQCIASIVQKTTYRHYEIVVVDNGSDDPATLAYFKDLVKMPQIQILRIDEPFNYSALNNDAVKVAKGELIGLMNNDIEVISSDWLDELVSHALRPGVGAVGARLWFPNETLQHGGLVLGLGGVAGHAHMGMARGQLGYQSRASLTQNLSAVTAACLVVKKSIFEAVGGLNERDLAVAFNDVDFCLRVREAGYRNVWTPFAELYHHESASRGYEDTPEKLQRFAKEMAYMHQRWGLLLQADPAYSPNLTLQSDDFSYAWPPRVSALTKTISIQPGQPSLSERLGLLVEGKIRVAYFSENVHSSTFRYRAANMAAVLNEVSAMGDVQTCAACFFSGDLEYAEQIVKNADILVISRARYDLDLSAFVQAFRMQGKRVLFDIDDLVFDTQAIDLIISTAGQPASDEVLNYWYGVVGRMAQALNLCDGVITTQSYLANRIKLFSKLPVKTIPNFANAAQLAVSTPLYQCKLMTGPAQLDRIKLGYFSGSSSHNGDLSLISYALERVMASDTRVELVLVGHVDVEQAFGKRFGGYLKGHLASRVTIHPFVDFVKLQELISEVDFNLIPLQVNDFTNCKSELKYVDAAIVGTCTIASATHAYQEAIRHGENGYIAADHEWEAILLQAIAIKDNDFDQHIRMTTAAFQDVQQRFTWQRQRSTILQALEIG
jgi:O-antigen biosynthesis protein